jgi:S1-C subfamily serine protease
MAAPSRTKYDDLGVPRTATAAEIEKAYRKYRSHADMTTSAPDRARDNRVKSAYETLSNADKRAIYDLVLARPERERRSKGTMAAIAGVVVLSGAAGLAYLLQPPPPPPPGSLSIEQLTHNASQAMGRVDSLDMSGKAMRMGLAFAIDEGVVATSCTGITPTSQLNLYLAPRTVAVKVAQADDKTGLCKLAAAGVGSWPLAITAADPSPGDTVYVTKMNAVGEVGLVEAKVKRVVASERGKVVETSIAVLPDRQGGPLLDAQGRVIGIAILRDPATGRGEIVRITPDWAAKP